MTKSNQLLGTAIKAAKAGEREKAHGLLLQIIEQDEENETAWLWLSGVVKTKADRQICLENVLVINPDNEIAKKGLKKLGVAAPLPPPKPVEVEEEDEIWDTPKYDIDLPKPNDPHGHKFRDVWSSSANICAYCAHPVEKSNKQCPKCKRAMVGKDLVNPKRSIYLIIWVVLRSLRHLFALISIFSFASSIPELVAELPYDVPFSLTNYSLTLFSLQLLSIGFTFALFMRQAWAYWLAIIGMVLSMLVFLGTLFLLALAPAPNSTPSDGASAWLGLLCLAPFIVLPLLYYYMVFMAGGDFKRVSRWRVAAVDDRIKDPLVLDDVAKLFAKEDKWATAVLYWQKAAGRFPGNVTILRHLADGYARLGFPERSLDTLKSAREKAKDPKVREALSKQIDQLSVQGAT